MAGFFLGLVGILLSILKIPKNLKKDYLLIVVWTTVSIYMALSAVRFVFNATPAFAILAGWVTWKVVDSFDSKRQSLIISVIAVGTFLTNLGILNYASEKDLLNEFYVKYFPYLIFLTVLFVGYAYYVYMKYRVKKPQYKLRKITTALIVGFFVIYPYVIVASDAAVPYEKKREIDPTGEYMGAFGHSLPGEYWIASFDWLSKQDADLPPEKRPAFISWWDYGFWCVYMGKHPTAADNFQYGYQFAGSFISATDEKEAIALMVARILEGDFIRHQGHFSKDVERIMKEYLNYSDNPSEYNRLVEIYSHPDRFIDEIEAHPEIYGHYIDITPMNAKYAAAKVLLLSRGEERLVELYGKVREATGKSLRYFAVDSRLFPFNARNTGIFYAPIKLADKDLKDYLEYYVYAERNYGTNQDPDWQPLPENPISMDRFKELAEEYPHKMRVKDYELRYTEDFYNSMFYKAYIGYGPADVGMTMDGKSVPAMKGSLSNYPPMQGWNMTHFRLVYRTMYWSPKDEKNSTVSDYKPMSSKEAMERYQEQGGDIKSGLGQGVFYLKYYDGAIISGRVLTKSGMPVVGARVTILDEYGIPHGSVLTDNDGHYTLLAPFGQCTLLATLGNLETTWDKIYQYKTKPNSREPENLLNLTQITISDEQAMRVKDWRITKDLISDDMTGEGRIYLDEDDSGSYDEKKDKPLVGVKVAYTLLGGNFSISNVTNEYGYYSLYNLPPGYYKVEMEYRGFKKVLNEQLEISPSSDKKQDGALKPVRVQGYVRLLAGGQAAGVPVIYEDVESGRTYNTTTKTDGYYEITDMLPGEYLVRVEREDFMVNKTILELKEGDNKTYNLTLLPVSYCDLKVEIPPELSGTRGESGASNVVVTFISRDDPTVRYSYFTDEGGFVRTKIPAGQYVIHAEYTSGERAFASVKELNLECGVREEIDLTLEEAFTVFGNVTKLENMPMKYQWVEFTALNRSITTYALTGPKGMFQISLPKDSYRVFIEEEITGSINTHFYMGYLYLPREEYIEVTYHTVKSTRVNGTVFWDMNEDALYTPLRNMTLSEAMKNPDTGLTDVGVPGATVRVLGENISMEVRCDEGGKYQVNIPPGDYRIEAYAPGYGRSEPAVVRVEDDALTMNEGLSEVDLPLRSNYKDVVVKAVYNRDGVIVPASGIEVSIVSLLPYMPYNETYTTSSDGAITLSLKPGYYRLATSIVRGVSPTVRFSGEKEFILAPSDDRETVVFEVKKEVEATVEVVYGNVTMNSAQLRLISSTGREYFFLTDEDGKATIKVPEGNYTLYVGHLFGIHHLLYIKRHCLLPSSWDLPERVELVEAYEYSGRVVIESRYLKDYALKLRLPYYEESIPLDTGGGFTTYVLPGERYNVSFELKSSVKDVQTLYVYSSTFWANSTFTGVVIEPEVYVKVEGTVFYDEDDDHFIQEGERKGGVNVTFVDRATGYTYQTVAEENGDYSLYVPKSIFDILVDVEGFEKTPKDYCSYINTSLEVKKDISLKPSPILVHGIVFYDKNGNNEKDPGEILLPNTHVEFRAESLSAEDVSVETPLNGTYRAMLLPGTYTIYAVYKRGEVVRYAYVGEVSTEIGSPPILKNLTLTEAKTFTGTVFYYDTNGSLVEDLTSKPGNEILLSSVKEGGTIRVPYRHGVFTVALPVGNYTVKVVIVAEEMGKSMTYRFEEIVPFRLNTTSKDLAFELKKVKEYIIKMDTVGDEYKEIFMKAYQTITVPLYIENRGNLPFKVSFSTAEIPDGWKVVYSVSEIHLNIGERKHLTANITAPSRPKAMNRIKLQAKSEGGYYSYVEMLVNTPQYHSIEIITDAPEEKGVAFEQVLNYNLTLKNTGNGDEVVHFTITPPPANLTGWEVLLDDEKLSKEGKNLSLGAFGERRMSLKITVPNSTQANYGDVLHLVIEGVTRKGIVKRKVEMSFQIRKPDLRIVDIQFTNLDLKNKVLNRTVKANVTVMSLNREVGSVRVVLKVDDKEVGNKTIDYIPENGIAYVEFEFNVTVEGIKEDQKHSFQVVIDPQNTVEEENEEDNVYIVKKWVGEKPPSLLNPRVIAFVTAIIASTVALIVWYKKKHPF
ncbi:MAG: carboxypeptidase regulatory-like domain-containing protein [Thermoplasmata archaeon]|nr:carboxypeptidase regulatory-like domain-containing protein [Thermoplasmata archaeon]